MRPPIARSPVGILPRESLEPPTLELGGNLSRDAQCPVHARAWFAALRGLRAQTRGLHGLQLGELTPAERATDDWPSPSRCHASRYASMP